MYSAGNMGVNVVASNVRLLTITVDWPSRRFKDQAGGYR